MVFLWFSHAHLAGHLIQGLLALIVAAAHAGAALPTDGVNLIDEDDAGSFLLDVNFPVVGWF